MSDTVITCPECNAQIPLTQSLAAPIIAQARQDFNQQLAEREKEFVNREKELHDQETLLKAAKRDFDSQVSSQVAEALETEVERVKREESDKAQRKMQSTLSEKDEKLADLQEQLDVNNEKLTEAQKAQADLIILRRKLEDEKREMDLTIQTKIQEGLDEVREKAVQNAEEAVQLVIAEKDQKMTSLQRRIEELEKTSKQGSQQLQGEAQEMVLEHLLETNFPLDAIAAVSKGEFGGDVLHCVSGASDQTYGIILWESKRTKAWNNGWLEKLRQDQRAAKADLAVLVSETMPKGVDTFAQIDGVWVVSLRFVIPLAMVLRMGLIEISQAKQVAEGQQTKSEMIYEYLTGTGFRNRVSAIVEAFATMQDDLQKERRAIQSLWSKRQTQLGKALQAASGMYGDLQGIAGKSLKEIEGLELPELEVGDGSGLDDEIA